MNAGRRKGSAWFWLLAAAAVVLGLVALLAAAFPEALGVADNRIKLTRNLLWAAVLGSALVVRWRARPGLAIRQAALWLAIGAVLVLGYSFRFEARGLGNRLLAELIPSRGRESVGAITVSARAGGGFVVEAEITAAGGARSRKIRLLVDTGASDVVLSPADAKRLGFDLGGLKFNRRYATANGTVFGAPVRLPQMRIGPLELVDVRASVNGAAMGLSLLGMSFLSRLGGYRVSGGKLTLWQ